MNNPPPDLHHLGFVIANSDEEFLHDWKRGPGYSLLHWALSPALAHVFQTSQHARDVITLLDHHSKLWVLDLFESQNAFVVATDAKKRPKWLPIMQ
jgi:hypothetical protein